MVTLLFSFQVEIDLGSKRIFQSKGLFRHNLLKLGTNLFMWIRPQEIFLLKETF